jgi:capsular polysaccharide transport system permease protein
VKNNFKILFEKLKRHRLFAILVVCPSLFSIVYFSVIASDAYISESRFIIRSAQKQNAATGLTALFSSAAFSRASDDTFSVRDYALSRDLLLELDKKLELKAHYSSLEIDFLGRFPSIFGHNSFEDFHEYYSKHVKIDYDIQSNIVILRTKAYTKETARDINEEILSLSEKLVNNINSRAREDLVKYAQAEVLEAERKSKEAALALATYRNQRSVFDPERQSSYQLQQIGKLQDELITSKMQLAQLRSLTPENPQIPTLKKRVESLQTEVNSETTKMTGGTNSLSNKAADFERINLDRAFADRQLASAMASLEGARSEARRKSLYLERIVQPSIPDSPFEPKRIKGIIVVIAASLICWLIISLLIAGVREHSD